jgi:hypothetical protein
VCQAVEGKVRVVPVRLVVSRTTTPRDSTPCAVVLTSRQFPPLAPLCELLRQVVPTSIQAPPLSPL